ncbi:MAG: metal ABC transporter permease [Candidatus Bipolaricaulia bacterium]
MGLILEPLSHPFMVRGLVAAVLVGLVSPLVGSYVVLRGMAFFGDALAHAILPGVALGYFLSGGARGPLFWWALLAAILAALGIGALSRGARMKGDTAIGIIFAGMFALGIALISRARGYAVDLAHFLFGNPLAVSNRDLTIMAALAGAVLLLILVFYKEFLLLAFDPLQAAVLRLPVGFLHYLLLVLIASTAVIALQTVGVALTVALLVTPAATAQLVAKRLPTMMASGALSGVLSGVVGLYLSYYTGVASGAAIALVATTLFLLALFLRGLRRAVG